MNVLTQCSPSVTAELLVYIYLSHSQYMTFGVKVTCCKLKCSQCYKQTVNGQTLLMILQHHSASALSLTRIIRADGHSVASQSHYSKLAKNHPFYLFTPVFNPSTEVTLLEFHQNLWHGKN